MSEIFLIILYALMFMVIVIALIYIKRIKLQTKQAMAVLDDIADGNLDRRIITQEDTDISVLCYKINEIVISMKTEIINHQQSEKAYRQLVTSLSHDIRTPLTSLIGYISAVEDGIVENREKNEYIRLSLEKAIDLKDYFDTLFEWLKLESGERTFNFEELDICEYTREIITDWIPQFENRNLEYEIIIPETKIRINIDRSAYKRIINNLLQNIFIHSNARKICLNICIDKHIQTVEILMSDNGIGISEKDLPYIFDRLYKCDTARSIGGNGLGLAIVYELVKAHNGNISVSSILGQETNFTLAFPLSVETR